MKKKPELTPWFDGYVKPVRPGVYERKYPGFRGRSFNRWCGRMWFFVGESIEEASDEVAYSPARHLPWRGLAQDPKGKK